MFMNELTPLFKQLAQHPVSFMGGFVSGVLRLNLAEDPVKGWLDKQFGATSDTTPTSETHNNGKANGPQSISID
jgi:hypothetical protein